MTESASPLGRVLGLLQPGNIDLTNRPQVKMDDGSIATVRSMSFEEDGNEVLVPTVSPDGKILSNADAIDLYHRTGQHLGKFDNPSDANDYAQRLHVAQQRFYGQSQPDQTPAPAKPLGAWYYEPDIPSNFTAAGGVAGLGEIVDAAARQMQLVDNTNASEVAMTQAYDDRIAAIKAATGQGLENPIRQAQADLGATIGTINPALARPQANTDLSDQFGPPMPTSVERHGQDFTNRLRELQQQYPQFASAIRADVPIETDAAALAKAADENLSRLSGTRSLIPQLAANLVGGFEGSLNDPLQVATMFLGGGASEGRTVMARVGNTVLKEFLINGGVTASMQPDVQAWREKAGLPHGFDEGLKNTVFAGLLGAGFGAAGEVIGHVLGRAGHVGTSPLTGDALDATAEVLRQKANLSPEIDKALSGDHDAALTALRPIRDALPPEARAAVDLHESISAARDSIPDISSPAVHQANMDAAEKVARDPAANNFAPQLDPAKVDRIVSDLVPEAPAPRKSDRQSLAEFLIRAGGLKDQGGELTALDLQNASQKYVGRLVKDSGRPLDNAREIAAEAGFFNHIYGTPEEAMAKSTVADLLDELSHEGNRPVDARPDDGGRSYVEQRVTELMQQVGPEVDDKLIGKAVQLAEAEKIPLIDAFDRVAMVHERIAEAQGYNIDAYHGTSAVFRDFSAEFLGLNTKVKSAEKGFFFAKRPDTAHSYFRDQGLHVDENWVIDPEQAAIIPPDVQNELLDLLRNEGIKRKAELDAASVKDYDAEARFYDEANALLRKFEALAEEHLQTGNNIHPVRLKLKNPLVHDFKGESYREISYAELIDRAIAEGRDGAIFKNTYDGGPLDDIYVVFSPDQIRSRFDVIRDLNGRPDDPLALPTPEAEPSAEPDEALFTPDDLAGIDPHENMPFFDDNHGMTGQQMIDDLEELHGLFQLTEACKA